MLELFAKRRKKMTSGWFVKVKLISELVWTNVTKPNHWADLTGSARSWIKFVRAVPSGLSTSGQIRSGLPSDRSKFVYNPNFKPSWFAFRLKNLRRFKSVWVMMVGKTLKFFKILQILNALF